MKKVSKLLYVLSFYFAIFQIQSCKKEDLKELENYKPCRIEKIVFIKEGETRKDTAIFTYNVAGNPVSVRRTHVSTGSPNYLFRYDAKNRLKEYIEHYNGYGAQQWKFYTYGQNNRIIADTAYVFTTYNDAGTPPVLFAIKYVHRYTYDSQGRISSISTDELAPNPGSYGTRNFVYNGDGNLVSTGAVYDDKVNFLRTNKIWQFLNEDYSVNNRATATSYNPYLPLSFRTTGYYGPYFLSIPVNNADLYYNCGLPGVKIPKEAIKTHAD